MVSLSLPESGASKASAAYLSYFILNSRDSPQLLQIVREFGQDLTTRLLRCIGMHYYNFCFQIYEFYVQCNIQM